ncbi:MAG: amino acid ABC transporter permease [Propionibacteriaceae bacterium]
MNFDVIERYLPLYGQAALVTVQISLLGILLATTIGLGSALIRYARIPIASHFLTGYVEIARNTPLIVQLFFIYFGLPKVGILLSATTSAIAGLGFLGGGYLAEAFRSGFDAVGKIQWESAVSLGMKPLQVIRKVILPQALTRCIPALVATVIFLVKETSVVSVIALPDLVFRAKELIGREYNTAEALALLVFFYLLILLPLSLTGRWLERKARHAEFGI